MQTLVAENFCLPVVSTQRRAASEHSQFFKF